MSENEGPKLVAVIGPNSKLELAIEALWAHEACYRSNLEIGGLNVAETDALYRWQEHLHREALLIPHFYIDDEDAEPEGPHRARPDAELGRALVKRVLAVPEKDW